MAPRQLALHRLALGRRIFLALGRMHDGRSRRFGDMHRAAAHDRSARREGQ